LPPAVLQAVEATPAAASDVLVARGAPRWVVLAHGRGRDHARRDPGVPGVLRRRNGDARPARRLDEPKRGRVSDGGYSRVLRCRPPAAGVVRVRVHAGEVAVMRRPWWLASPRVWLTALWLNWHLRRGRWPFKQGRLP